MKKLLIILLSLPLMAFTIGDGHYFDVKKGNEKYEKGNYDEALRLYERAFSKKESDVSKYNLGNAHYRKGDYDAAAGYFSAMLNGIDAELASQGLTNFAASNLMAGFNKAEKGDSDSAIKYLKTAANAYKKILLRDPADKSAKENMEIALNKIKELEKQKQKQENENKKQEDKKQNEQEQSKQQNGRDEKKNEKGNDKKDAKSGKRDKEPKKHESADSKQKGKMSDEEVERILKALAQNEEKLQKRLRQKRTRNYDVEKDW